jgi:DNA-binding MarR family transcriptional regulator
MGGKGTCSKAVTKGYRSADTSPILKNPYSVMAMSRQSFNSSAAGARGSRAEIISVVDSLRSIVQSLRISGRFAEQQAGISSAQLFILEELAERPAQSINELAERTFTHQSSVSMVVSRLAESRLVSRTSAPGDARRLLISLTPAGRALLKKAPDTAQARLIDGLRTLDKVELRGLADYLSTLDEILVESTAESRKHGGSTRIRQA